MITFTNPVRSLIVRNWLAANARVCCEFRVRKRLDRKSGLWREVASRTTTGKPKQTCLHDWIRIVMGSDGRHWIVAWDAHSGRSDGYREAITVYQPGMQSSYRMLGGDQFEHINKLRLSDVNN